VRVDLVVPFTASADPAIMPVRNQTIALEQFEVFLQFVSQVWLANCCFAQISLPATILR
jgi:hypothetical protein